MLFLDKHEIQERICALDVEAVWSKIDALLPPDKLTCRAEVSELVMTALEKFIAQFPGEIAIDLVEDWINAPLEGGYNFRGIVDAAGWHRVDGRVSRFVIDFKTSSGALDWRWRSKLNMSMQPRLYMSAMDADRAYIVGLTTREDFSGNNIEILTYSKSDTLNEDVRRYLSQTIKLYEAVANDEVFPQNRPTACIGASKCHFYEQCLSGTMPRKAPERIEHWSATSLQMFHECPERWRRIKCGEQPEPTQNMIVGSAAHLGIATCLRQIWELPEPETDLPLLTSISEEATQ